MRNVIYNAGYFLKEVRTIVRLNMMSNVFSIISISMIFFILSMVVSGWWASSQIVEAIQGEAEINVYFKDGLDAEDVQMLVSKVGNIDGVREARLVDENEAYRRMEEILGKDARVMEYFDDNPFSPFIEMKIQIGEIGTILEELERIDGIEHVRDNREVLDRIESIAGVLGILGYLVVAAVGISTIVIISHIIRMGIYDNREQIKTLRLMGAPESFIAFPFLLEGLLLTFAGGALASVAAVFALKYVYAQITGPLPFIPVPPLESIAADVVLMIMSLSMVLGAAGSIFGFSSAGNR